MPPPPTERTRVRQRGDRGTHDLAAIHRILDEGLVCHVGFVAEGQPLVIPMNYARAGDRLYLHGSATSRVVRTLAGGAPACATVTLLDGLVLARSAMHHSVNYRSVVVLGRATAVEEPAEKVSALRAIVEHVVPGRWAEVRPPSARELEATGVLALPITEASAKMRSGPPVDDAADLALGAWAGVLPLATVPGAPVPDPALPPGRRVPPYVSAYSRSR